jgi:hypothetical protein
MSAALRCAGGAALVALGLLSPADARGQAEDAQRAVQAQALYEQATAEMDAGSYESACPKLLEVTKLVPDGIGAKLTLARCFEGRGKLASAWGQYSLVASAASKAGQAARAEEALNKAAALRPRLAQLTINVPAELRALPGLSVTYDGLQTSAPQWGAPFPVDVGEHTLSARALGRKDWFLRFPVKEDGAQVAIEVQLPPADPAPKAAPSKGQAGAGGESERRFQRPLGIAAMALGGAGLVVGGALGGLAISKFNESNDGPCNSDNRCNDAGLELRSDAVAFGDASTAVFIASAVMAAAGVTLFATAPSPSAARARISPREGGVSAAIELLPGGARVSGSW